MMSKKPSAEKTVRDIRRAPVLRLLFQVVPGLGPEYSELPLAAFRADPDAVSRSGHCGAVKFLRSMKCQASPSCARR